MFGWPPNRLEGRLDGGMTALPASCRRCRRAALPRFTWAPCRRSADAGAAAPPQCRRQKQALKVSQRKYESLSRSMRNLKTRCVPGSTAFVMGSDNASPLSLLVSRTNPESVRGLARALRWGRGWLCALAAVLSEPQHLRQFFHQPDRNKVRGWYAQRVSGLFKQEDGLLTVLVR